MPSSHSATVMGLACAVGLREGLDGSLFAISFVLASVVRILNFHLFESTSNLNVNNKS
jgi:acid phosphatase family membrane protein YuiD